MAEKNDLGRLNEVLFAELERLGSVDLENENGAVSIWNRRVSDGDR